MTRIASTSPVPQLRKVAVWIAGLALALGAIGSAPVAQTQYTYTVVADLANSSASEPAINASGQVAFIGYDGVLQRLDGTVLTSLYAVGPGLRAPTGPVSINASGAVAFYAYSFVDLSAILVADGIGPVVTVASAAAGPWFPSGAPAINDQGQVVFTASNGADPGTYVVTGNLVPLASPGDAAPGGTIVGAGGPDINNNGQVTYSAAVSDLTTRILRTTLAPSGTATHMGSSPSAGVRAFGMNDSGDVAYWAPPTAGAGAASIFVSNGTTTSTVFAGSAGLVPEPYRVAMNNLGHVAFMANAASGYRVLVSDGVSLREVVRTGDTIPGLGVVEVMYIGNEAINDAGQVAILVRYDNGNRHAIVRAEPANQPPLASDLAVATNEDAAVNGTLVASDANNDPLTYSLVSNGSLGIATITDASTGAFSYVPNPNAHGTDTFTFRANDGSADSNVAVVSVTISPVNDAPVALNGTVTVVEDTPASFTLPAVDVDLDTLTYAVVANGALGTAVVTDIATGAYTYTPQPGASGSDAFTFQVSDGTIISAVATIAVDITPANDAPDAQSGVVTTSEGIGVAGAFAASDADGDALTYSVVTQPAGGVVTITNAATGAFSYLPNAGITGYDPFTFSVSDGTSTATATQMTFVAAGRPRWPGQTVRVDLGAALAINFAVDGSGRFIAFEALGANIVPGDTNGAPDVFVHDRLTGSMDRVSVASDGSQGNGPSGRPAMTPDGRFVVFYSTASNLVAGDTNGLADVFVRDRSTGQTQRVSVSTTGAQSNGVSLYQTISADGRFVAFASGGSNLVSDDTNGADDIFVRDRDTGQTRRVSVTDGGVQGTFDSYLPSISADGRFVALTSRSVFVPGDTNGVADVFVHDRLTNQTSRVSVGAGGEQGNSTSEGGAISADGRIVAFQSSASNLVAGDTNGRRDILVRDRTTGTTVRASVAAAGGQSDGNTQDPSISADGRYVSFSSDGADLVAGDTNAVHDIFVRDLREGVTRRISVAGDGTQANGSSPGSRVSGDGRFVVFGSSASNLVAGSGASHIYAVGGVSVTPTSQQVPTAGGSGVASVQFAYPGTSWTASSNDAWITVTNQSSSSGDGTVTYSVAANDAGPRTGTIVVALHAITVTQDGTTTPVAQGGAVATSEDVTVAGTLSASDPNGDALTFSIVANGSLGTAVITDAATGTFLYTPAPNANGIDSFSFQASDGVHFSNVATIAVTIAPVNDAPVALDGTLAVSEDTPGSAAFGAADIDGPSLIFSVVGNGTRGNAVITNPATGAFTYTPHDNAFGLDSVTFQASDGTLTSNTATLNVAIAPTNDAPVAITGVVSTSEGGAVSGVLQASDLDAETLTFSLITPATQGAVTITDAATGTFTYAPDPGAIGYDTFTFQAQDATGAASTATQMVFVVAGAPRWPGQTMRASVSSTGVEVPGPSFEPVLNADGRFVAFVSESAGLVAADTNATADAFVRDRQLAEVTRASVAGAGEQANQGSVAVAMSATGRYLAFESSATNLIPTDTNGMVDVFRKDRLTGAVQRVSVGAVEGNGHSQIGNTRGPAISADGQVIAFHSVASNLVDGDANGTYDVFVRDVTTDQTSRVSVATSGEGGNGLSAGLSLSADGRVVAFSSNATNLVSSDTVAQADVFVRDRVTGQTTLVSGGVGGQPANGSSAQPGVSADGRHVAFRSSASNLVAGDTNLVEDIFVHDRQTLITTRVNVAADGTEADGTSDWPSLSADGRYVAFASRASNLVPDDANGGWDIFVHDRFLHETRRVSVASDGTPSNGDQFATPPFISADGRFVGFRSSAPLVANDTNGERDVFVVGGVVVEPGAQSVSSAGGSFTASATFAYPGTPWTALVTAPWITVTGQSSPNGSGLVSYTVGPNFGPARSGTLVVALQTVVISQEEGAEPLAVTLLAPNGGERVFAGVPTSIRWTATGAATSFDVELSLNGGTTFAAIPGCAALPATALSCAWTPLAPGTTTARVRVIARAAAGDVTDASDANVTISTAVPTVTVTAPNTAVSWIIGTTQNLRWNHNLGLGATMRVELSRDGGASWEVVAASTPNTAATSSTLPWVVAGPPSAAALLRVIWIDGTATDVSNTPFSIVRPTVTVTAPNTAVQWSVGSTRTIAWTHNAPAGQLMTIEVSRDTGATWSVVATGVANTTASAGSFVWVPTGPETAAARVRLSTVADPQANDVSNVDFAIVAPSLTVTTPNTAVNWRVASSQNLRASHNLGSGQPVEFQISRDGGATWTAIGQVTTTTSASVTLPWVVTLPIASDARIRAVWTSNPTIADSSDVSFRILSRITVTAPNRAVTWGAGTSRAVTWTHNLGLVEPVQIDVSADSGTSWIPVASNVANTTATGGSTTITLPPVVSAAALVRVSQGSDPANFDVSDVPFALAAATITVTAPNTNALWTIGTARTITWSHNLGTAERVTIDVSRDDGLTWTAIAANLPVTGNTSGTFSWTVTGPATAAARVRVTWDEDTGVQDSSNVAFRIQ